MTRIAMWSGPRNLSTAMMYAFGNRPDCAVVDEPFYAAYLDRTGLNHPMQQEILDAQPTDPMEVVAGLTGPVPGGRAVFYQKHMAHHMVPSIPRDWLAGFQNVFLIRHPARVIASYAAKREDPTLNDIGVRQQAELYDQVAEQGAAPIVIDSHDIRDAPEQMMRALVAACGLPWTDAMLSWPPGGHESDGVWAQHWYGAVHRSTGFAGAEGPLPVLEGDAAALCDAAMQYYNRLKSKAIRPSGT